MNVSEIAALQDGMPVTGFQCRIVTTYPPKTGTGQYGAWALMNLVVEDEQENRIKVTWSDEKDVSVFPANHADLMGEVVVISARLNQKKQMFGAKKGTYEGAPQVEVKGKHLTRSGRPTQPAGHNNDPDFMKTPPAAAKSEAPKVTTAMQPKEKLTVPNVLALAGYLAEELSTTYRSLVAQPSGSGLHESVEAMILDKTGQAVVTILMATFKGEIHATNQIIEEQFGSADPFGPEE